MRITIDSLIEIGAECIEEGLYRLNLPTLSVTFRPQPPESKAMYRWTAEIAERLKGRSGLSYMAGVNTHAEIINALYEAGCNFGVRGLQDEFRKLLQVPPLD